MICNGLSANSTVAPMMLGIPNKAYAPKSMDVVFNTTACGLGEFQAQMMNGQVVNQRTIPMIIKMRYVSTANGKTIALKIVSAKPNNRANNIVV